MDFPAVNIRPGDTIFQADEKVERVFEALGCTLYSCETLNTLLSTSQFCHFFQVGHQGRQCILVVMTRPWDEQALITVLQVLLGMRIEPDPPGSRLLFQFYSAYEVPEILRSLFGDSPACEFECRSSLVARFGNDLSPGECQQIAAVATHLSRECFSLPTALLDPEAEKRIVEAICDYLRSASLEVEPLNSLIALGCFWGEILRARLPYASRWENVEEFKPWPGLVFRSQNDAGTLESAGPRVAFDPIVYILDLYKTSDRELLARTREELLERCRQVLGPAEAAPAPAGPA
jgi:hypothetical protein